MDDIFEGSPREKFYDILFNANRNLVAGELDKIFEKFVAMSELCEKKGISQAEIIGFVATQTYEMENGMNDIYIGLAGDILSQNE